MESVLIAYSGGVDSTFLIKVASDVLGDKVLAVTSDSPTITRKELGYARSMARKLRVRHKVIKTDEMDCKDFVKNNPTRCFWCKSELFTKLNKLVDDYGLKFVVDGSNYSDVSDYRPGLRAAKELGVRSPLIEASLTKTDIRHLLKNWGIEIWDKPATACLSSRVPYGRVISVNLLKKIEKAEDILHRMGFSQVRVRDHEDIARIEVPSKDFHKFLDEKVRRVLSESMKDLGYSFITIDVEGYRTGSFNEAIFKNRDTDPERE